MSQTEGTSVYVIAEAGTSDQPKKEEKENGQLMPNPVSASERKRPRIRRGRPKRNVAKDVTVRICLSLLVFTYACVGGLLFHLFESDQDGIREKEMLKWINDTAITLATQLRLVTPHEEVWFRTIHHFLDIFYQELAVGYDRGYIFRVEPKAWSFKNSVLFSVSLMTATDNFEATPRSIEGKISVILFSIIGIPLTATWLLLLGEGLASMWIHLLTLNCKCPSREKVKPTTTVVRTTHNSTSAEEGQVLKQETEVKAVTQPEAKATSGRRFNRRRQMPTDYLFLPASLSVVIFFLYFLTGATVISFTCEGWTLLDSIYALFLTMSTTGARYLLPTYSSSSGQIYQIRKSDYFFTYLLIGYVILSFSICTIHKCINKRHK